MVDIEKRKFRWPFLSGFLLFLFQCSSQNFWEHELTKGLENKTSNYINIEGLKSSRKVLFGKLNEDIRNNDTIILVERFSDELNDCWVSIYYSNTKEIKNYKMIYDYSHYHAGEFKEENIDGMVDAIVTSI
ncbi:MAG: hypothetical protein LUG18_01300 [Candidatus Azobacteroides sp.]|nr:hypothetical protein [Candidatus Azobacteroides sp.]